MIFKLFYNLDFSIPKKKKYLVFDNLRSKYFKHYLGESLNVINFRDNKFSFFAILYALIFFYRSELKIEYIKFFLNFSEKKIILSFNYNRLILYRLKKYYPNVKIIIIQNGISNKFFIDKLKKSKIKLSCDYFLCMTKIEKKIFEKYIDANFIIIGSFLNNYYQKENKKDCNEILIISQYRDKDRMNDLKLSYQNTHEFLIRSLIKFLKVKKFKEKISILGSSSNPKKEKIYFKKFFKRFRFNFYQKKEFFGYNRVDNSKIVLGIDSTLLFEAFARNKKVGIFNLSGNFDKYRVHDTFLWKYYLKGDGIFWIRSKNEKKIFKIFNYLLNCSNIEWSKIKKKYKDLLIKDEGNQKFIKIINSIS